MPCQRKDARPESLLLWNILRYYTLERATVMGVVPCSPHGLLTALACSGICFSREEAVRNKQWA